MSKRILYTKGCGIIELEDHEGWEVGNDDEKLHRLDGPAVICPDGGETWYRDGLIHRDDDGPAHTEEKVKVWWKNGKIHRLYAPARIYTTGEADWLIFSKNKTAEIERWIKDNNLPHWTMWDDEIKLLFKLTWCY